MNKFLVCVDGSKKETDVLSAAVALARRTGAQLLLFRSVGLPSELPPAALSMAIDEVPALLQRKAEAALTELAKGVPPELYAGARVDIGNPWQSIERAAAEEDVDMIIVGSHGYHGLDRVLGTTAAKVVNHADRSVLVVRDPQRLARSRG
jgi:nucleotide-binding universal stress UspA family protein